MNSEVDLSRLITTQKKKRKGTAEGIWRGWGASDRTRVTWTLKNTEQIVKESRKEKGDIGTAPSDT